MKEKPIKSKTNAGKQKDALNDQQRKFAIEYVIDFNRTQAAIRAGYSRRSASEIGCTLLKNIKVQDLIAELISEQQNRTKITADMVVREVAKLGFANVKSYYDPEGRIKAIHDLTDDEAAAIHKVKTKEFVMMDGKSKIVETTFELHSKPGALDMLMKHTGAYDKDNKQKTTGQVVFYLPENGRE